MGITSNQPLQQLRDCCASPRKGHNIISTVGLNESNGALVCCPGSLHQKRYYRRNFRFNTKDEELSLYMLSLRCF